MKGSTCLSFLVISVIFFFFLSPTVDRVQREHEGLPQLSGLLGLRQCKKPGGGGAGGGEPPEAVQAGQGRAVHEHPAGGGSRR